MNSIFDAKVNPTTLDCEAMSKVVLARGLIKSIRPGEFNDLWKDAQHMPKVGKPNMPGEKPVPLPKTKRGDWLMFFNDDWYFLPEIHRGGFWV